MLDAKGNWLPGAVLTVDLYVVPDPAYPDTVARLCTIPVPIEVTVDVAPAEDLDVWAWWRLNLAPVEAAETGCPAWAGREWLVGAGAYDTRLDPALYAAELAETELFGLYIREDHGAPLYVMGVVGTTAMYNGKIGLAVPPLTEGEYNARSLLLLSLPLSSG
jgi:hypothetical protein